MSDRKITEPQIAEGEYATIAAKIAIDTHYGFLDGVEVDFRHPMLPLGEWVARPFWYVWSDGDSHAGVLFPSEASHCDIREIRKIKGIESDFPVVYVNAGDKIKVKKVFIYEEDRRFDHPHDKESRLAVLDIVRENGEVISVPGHLAFRGATEIRNGPIRSGFDNIISRIAAFGKSESIYHYELADVPTGGRYFNIEERAAFLAHAAHKNYFDCDKMLDEIGGDKIETIRSRLNSIANLAALSGFMLGKAESRYADEMASKMVKSGQQLGRRNTNYYWIEEAIRLWAENPKWSINKMARQISGGDENDKRSIMKAPGVIAACPVTSPSYTRCQGKIDKKSG